MSKSNKERTSEILEELCSIQFDQCKTDLKMLDELVTRFQNHGFNTLESWKRLVPAIYMVVDPDSEKHHLTLLLSTAIIRYHELLLEQKKPKGTSN